MRSLVTYLVLLAFNFIAFTPAGISLSQLRADDFELDELDLGLDDEEPAPSSSSSNSESEDFSFEDEEYEPASSESSGFSSDSSGKKKIAAFYLFPDSFSQKSAGSIAAETAYYLSISSDYDYLNTEAEFFVPSMSVAKRDLEEIGRAHV